MKNILRIIATVSSILTVFSCNKEIDQPIDQPSEPETYTLSISASKGEFTRGLELDGNTLNAIWKEGERVFVFKNDQQIGVLSPIIETLVYPEKVSCTLSGPFITVPADGDVLTLYFASNNYLGQDGTLDFIADYCDYAVSTLHVTGINNGQIQSQEGSANFVNQQAIVKFTLKDKADGTTLLTPSTLTVNDGTSDIATVTPTNPAATYTTNGDGVLYVAIPPISGDLTITASDGTFNYKYTKTEASFTAGQYYNITVKMIKYTVDLSTLTGDYEAQDGDILTGTLSGNHQITIADGATVTLKDVEITNLGTGCHYAGITCLGDATVQLIGTNSVMGGMDDGTQGSLPGDGVWPGIFVPEGKTLTIDGAGSLDARSNGISEYQKYAPGIGGDRDNPAGNIVIQGGTVVAHGGEACAGIGSGYTGCGDITITGSANITATGGSGAAGIGSGTEGTCGDITISTTGTVTAQGGDCGAGIGSGIDGYCGDITISTTGTVTAQGGSDFGAGIGSGYANFGTSQCGSILISKGTIVATGGTEAAGIGTGYASSHIACGTITIENTVTSVTATKGEEATDCIGRGSIRNSTCGTVTIGGTVYWGLQDGSTTRYVYKNGGGTYLTTSPLVYTPGQ